MRVGFRGAAGKIGLLAIPAALAVIGLIGLHILGVISSLTVVSGALAILAVLLGVLVAGRFRREKRASATIDFVAHRLINVESRLSALDHGSELSRPADLDGVTADITLLSGLVKSLAEAMAAQDQEIAELRGRLDRLQVERAPVELPRPVAGPERPLPPPGRPMPDRFTAADRPAPQAIVEAGPANRIVPSLLPALDERPAARARTEAEAPSSEARRQAILEAITAERVELFLQPVMSLPQRRTKFYEVLARLRLADDTLLAPPEFMPQLERLGRLAQLDRTVVSRALAIATHLATQESEVRLACNLSPASLRDADVLSAIAAMLHDSAALAGQLIIEIPQRSWRSLSPEVTAAADRLRALGVTFSLDHATDLRFEGITLGERGVTFVKLPTEMLLGAVRPGDDPGPIAALSGLLAKHGVHLVAERVERESQIPDLIDLDIGFAQGFALGSPRAVRPDFALARGPATAPVVEPAAPAPAATERPDEAPLPFSAFLRRTA